MITPVSQYNNYYFQAGRLLGFLGNEMIEVKISNTEESPIPVYIQDFFVKDKIIYLETVEVENTGTEEEPIMESIIHYYSQDNGVITEIEELPEKPVIGYSVFNSKNFSITKGDYQGKSISVVQNKFAKSSATFKQVFGAFETASGLFFNVIESQIPNKQEGLYFYPKDRKAVVFVSSALISGFLW